MTTHRLKSYVPFPLVDDPVQSTSNLVRVLLDVRFPQSDHTPPPLAQRADGAPIPCSIHRDLLDPVSSVGPDVERELQPIPISTVPEVSITEHGKLDPRKHDIWATWKVMAVSAVAKA